jgi:succinoglycan biosynthesis protein ExoA
VATTSDISPLVTVVIPARNEEGHIGATLDSISGQTESDLQIIVVDNASSDATPQIVRDRATRDKRIELLSNPDVSIPKSLNLALAAAKGRWFVRVDAHSTIPDDYVGKAKRHLEEGGWAGVGGRKDAVGVTPAGKAIAVALSSPFGVGNSVYHYGTKTQIVDHIPFGSYRTELLREIGGWNEDLVANEDYELDYRLRKAGHELLFDPSISISWQCRQSIGELWHQYIRYGRGKADVAELHPESLALRHLAAPALVANWLVALSLRKRRPRWLLWAFGPYLVGLAVATKKSEDALAADADRSALPAAFVAMHVGWGLGFWQQVIKNRGDRRAEAKNHTTAGDRGPGDSGDFVTESL